MAPFAARRTAHRPLAHRPLAHRLVVHVGPAAAIAIALAMFSSAHADVTNWIDTAGGAFSDPSNWSNGVPGSGDTAVFAITPTSFPQVIIAGPTTIDRLLATASHPTLVLSGQTLSVLGASPELPAVEIGDDVGNNTLFIRQGALVAPSVSVGPLAGGGGTLYLGQLGAVTATIGSTLVGDQGSGSLFVLSPASSFTTGELWLGLATSGSGVFSSVGNSNTVVTGDAHVGIDGIGRIWTTNHDVHIEGDLYTGAGPASEGELRLQQDGGDLVVDGSAFFGGEGLTTVSMTDGPHLVIGGDLTVASTATVDLKLWNHTVPAEPALSVAGSIVDPEGHLQPRLKISGSTPVFTPPIGSVYAVIASGTPTKWPELQVPAISLARRYVPVETPTLLAVEVQAGLADLNGDNAIDQADLDVLLGAWGRGSSPADFNGDGTVDGADLGMFLSALGV
ncbi:MAG: hypothetical protein KDA22_05260 [Phycisphaerales bacterium]|nr:hypothetical protein [Phycisphaerales bacterium]